MTDKVAVIIPFYQEEPGILRRALDSVCAQTGVSNVEVIVVDDGSPVPAREELRDLNVPQHVSWRVLEQNNAGPGTARNTGLDRVGDDTRYVAFLDSDDAWTADHLCRAVAALAKGYDFYFSNYFAIGQVDSAFERNEGIGMGLHPRISGLHDIHEYCGDFFSQQVLQPVATHTSTVVYRYADFRRLRFSEKLVHACEDKLFWLEIAADKPKIAFSSRPECHNGLGANIYHGTRWGTGKALKVLYCDIMYNKEVSKKYKLDAQLKIFSKKCLKVLRRDFASNLLHIIRRRERFDPKIVFNYYMNDPTSIFRLFVVASLIVAEKIGVRVRRRQ